MTSSERISTARATPSTTPVGTPKTGGAGADDFAKTLTQARGSNNTPSARSAAPAPGRAQSEAVKEETPSESASAASAPKNAKATRTSRDPNEMESPAEEASVGPEVAVAVNAAQAPPATEPTRALPEGDTATSSTASTGSADRAVLAVADTPDGATVSSPEVSALGGTVGESLAAADGARGEPGAQASSRPLASSPLVAGELRTNVAQRVDQSVGESAIALVTDALRGAASVANAADANTTSVSTPDIAANAALSQLTAAASASDSAVATRTTPNGSQHTLHTPVGAHAWKDELATRLTWMVDQRQHAATLRLSPENLGPLEVRIDVRENQVSVWFGASQADTRAAIESALPRLRELLEGQGLSLADAGVSQQSHRESPKHSSTSHGIAVGEADAASEMSVALRVGLFDGYA